MTAAERRWRRNVRLLLKLLAEYQRELLALDNYGGEAFGDEWFPDSCPKYRRVTRHVTPSAEVDIEVERIKKELKEKPACPTKRPVAARRTARCTPPP